MNKTIFQDLFEYQLRHDKLTLEKNTEYLLFPKLTIYSPYRYDGTVTQWSVDITTIDQEESITQAYITGQRMINEQLLHKQQIETAFLSTRLFFDTEKVKGNQVLLNQALTIQGETGECFTSFKNEEGIIFDKQSTGVFGRDSQKDIFKLLRSFFTGADIVIPAFVSFSELLTTEQLIEKCKLIRKEVKN